MNRSLYKGLSYLLIVAAAIVIAPPIFAKPKSIATLPLPTVAQATTTLVMRAESSASAAKVKCDIDFRTERGKHKRNATALPKGFSVTVIERSAKKSKVGRVVDFWYKIQATDTNSGAAPICLLEDGETATAWVFGAYLTVE